MTGVDNLPVLNLFVCDEIAHLAIRKFGVDNGSEDMYSESINPLKKEKIMASDATRALAADVMRYIATHGEVQGLSHRRAPLDLSAPKKTLSDLRYLEDIGVEDADDDYRSYTRLYNESYTGDDYRSYTRLYNESYAEVTVKNVYGELCVMRLKGTMSAIIADVLADAAPEVSFDA